MISSVKRKRSPATKPDEEIEVESVKKKAKRGRPRKPLTLVNSAQQSPKEIPVIKCEFDHYA